MPITPHRKASIAFQKELYIESEKLLESGPSYVKWAAMIDDLVKRMIPLTWPKASPKLLKEIAIHIPLVNCGGDKKKQAADARKIEEVLLMVFPVRSAVKKRPIPPATRRA